MSRNLAKLIGLSLVLSIATGLYAANAAPQCYGRYGSNNVPAGYYCDPR